MKGDCSDNMETHLGQPVKPLVPKVAGPMWVPQTTCTAHAENLARPQALPQCPKYYNTLSGNNLLHSSRFSVDYDDVTTSPHKNTAPQPDLKSVDVPAHTSLYSAAHKKSLLLRAMTDPSASSSKRRGHLRASQSCGSNSWAGVMFDPSKSESSLL